MSMQDPLSDLLTRLRNAQAEEADGHNALFQGEASGAGRAGRKGTSMISPWSRA